MKKMKNFNEFIFEGIDINKKQFIVNKILSHLKIKLFYVSTYQMSFTMILPLMEKFFEGNRFSFDKTPYNKTLLYIYAYSILCYENKDKLRIIYDELHSKNIQDKEIQYAINVLNNIKLLFIKLMDSSDKHIKTFIDVLKNNALFIPYLSVLTSLINNERLNIELFTGKFADFQLELGEENFNILIIKIINKMNIIAGGTNKLQNKENAKPFLVNDEFKSPMYQSEKPFIYDNLTEGINDYLTGPSDEEIMKKNHLIGLSPDRLLVDSSKIGYLVGVKKALESGADLHCDEDNALVLACKNGKADVVKYLIEQGADVHTGNDEPLKMSAFSGSLDTFKAVIDSGEEFDGETQSIVADYAFTSDALMDYIMEIWEADDLK